MRVQFNRWWELTLRGIVAIVFGILLLARLGTTSTPIVLTIGIWLFLDGVVAFITAIARHGSWELTLEGVTGIILGAITFGQPHIAAAALYAIAVVWLLVIGALKIVAAVRRGRELSHTGDAARTVATGHIRDDSTYLAWLGLSGALSVMLGILLIAAPRTAILLLASWLGIYAIIVGAILVATSAVIHRSSKLPA